MLYVNYIHTDNDKLVINEK